MTRRTRRRQVVEAVLTALGLLVTVPTVTALIVLGLRAERVVTSIALTGSGLALTLIVAVLILLVRNPPHHPPRGHHR